METLDIIQRLAADVCRLPGERLLRAGTLNEAGIDSLAAIDLIFAIETRFSIAIAAEDVSNVQTLRDLAVMVDRLVTRRAHCHDE
jgi:acyl carrier protein